MSEAKTIGFILVETPLHCGTGQDIGIVDQPIQRERHTNYPIIQASELKGVFRQYYKKNNGKNVDEIFGPEISSEVGGEYASCVVFGDARILFFPVKSLKSVYVWITCKDVLDKFSRTLKLIGYNNITIPNGIVGREEEIIIYDDSLSVGNYVVLEEYKFEKQLQNQNPFNDIVEKIITNNNQEYNYLKQSLKNKICIVSDNVFKDFVEMSTEVITRIKIDEATGVVKKRALWSEEYLPTDTVLYFPLIISAPKKEVNGLNPNNILEEIKSKINSYIQIGGNETIGKGFVKITWL